MGFMDMLGGAAGKLMANGEQVNTYKKEYKSLSDNQLLDIMSKYSRSRLQMSTEEGQRFHAAYGILEKERGYDADFLKLGF